MKTSVHLDFDLYESSENPIHFHSFGNISFDYKEVILDPSVLYYLTFHKIKVTQITYYLPDNLLRLIAFSKENKEYREFLKSFLTYFRYGWGRYIEEDLTLFYANIEQMMIKPISSDHIPKDQKDNYYENYLKLFSDHDFYISMSPKINFLGDCIAKTLEFSRLRGIVILSKSRKLANFLREKVASLELPKMPDHLDNSLRVKGELLNRMFDFKGGRTTKFFIAVCLGVGGFIHPSIGAISVAFVFIDP